MEYLSDKEILEILGKKLKQIRLNENYTQQFVADKIGIDRATLSLIENGHNTTLTNFIKLLRVYKKVDELNTLLYLPKYNVMEMLKLEKKRKKNASHKR
ncbi:MAG: helix-turn-helix transcriptional regulator [Flavobacteriaceae bacterium]